MDRRRYVPKPEGLEGRSMMSILGGSGSSQIMRLQNAAFNVTILRAMRIDRLPGYLGALQNGHVVPAPIIAALQNDLVAIQSKLDPAPSRVLNDFNHELRTTIEQASLSKANAQTLNAEFGGVLESAGAKPEVTAKFRADMNDLARFDSNNRTPTLIVANDYGLIAQMTQGIGVPLRFPPAPHLAAADQVRKGERGVTAKSQPRIVGRYDVQSTMEIISETGAILGVAPVQTSGIYVIKFAQPLAPGTYTVFVRGVNDLNLNVSRLSEPLTITVVTPPQGPLGKK